MALEESSVLEAELARQSDPGRSEASGSKKRKQQKAPRDPPSERRPEEKGQEDPLRREVEIEGLTAAGHQALVRGHKKEALLSFKKAFALSSETPRHAARRVCAFNLGAAYVEAGKPEKGLALLLEAQPEEGQAAGERLGDLFFNIGVAHEGLGDFGQALEAFRKAQGHYCAVRTESEAGTRMRMGDCYLGMGDPSRASQCFLEAGRAYAGAGSLESAATALSEAARLMLRSREHEDSEVVKVLNECRELCEQIPDRALLGKLYNDIGLSFSQLKIFSLAAESFAKALPFCQTEDGEEDRATREDAAATAAVLQNLGATHNALGSFSTAVGFHQRAASLHSVLGNRRAQGQCFGNLAYALSQLSDHEAAVENYLHALQAFKDSGDLQGQWQAWEGLGGSRFHLGDPEKAVASYKEALMLISKCQDAPETVAQERIVNKLAEALQSKLSVSNRLLQGSGILTAGPARHFPMSQTSSPVRFAASSLHRKKENFPPAVCYASELSAGQRCHRTQATEKPPPALATWSHGPLQWGKVVVAQTTGLKPKQGGCGELAHGAACPNEISALGVPNGHAILASDGTEEDTHRATTFPDQIRGNRPGLPMGRFSHRRSDTSQQGWRNRFKSIFCTLM